MTAAHLQSVAMFSDTRIGTDTCGRIASNDHAVSDDRWLRGIRGDEHVRLHVRVDPNRGSGTNALNGNVVALPFYTGLAAFVKQAPSLLTSIRSAVSCADIVVTRLPGLIGLGASITALLYSKPLATELVGDPYESLAATDTWTRRLMGYLAGRMTSAVVRRASVVRYVTQRVLQESYPPGPHTITVAASDVDLARWLVDDVEPESPEPTVIAVGSQEQLYKGHSDLILAIALMRNSGLRSRLVLVGHGKYHEQLRRFASEAGLDGHVSFVGYVDDVVKLRHLVDRAWLYAMPSHTEGLPRSLVEAMARGKACVGTDVGGIRELLSPAYRVPPKDPAQLAAVLTRVLCDPSERHQAGYVNAARARDYAFSSASQGAAWPDAVDRLRRITHA